VHVDDKRHAANRVLATLSLKDFERVEAHLERVDLAYRQSLYEANKPIQYVYFLESGVASLVKTMRNGSASEVGTIGNEGIVGLPVVLGDARGPTSVYMQVPGQGFKMEASLLAEEMKRSESLKVFLLRYAHAFFNQVALSAACSHHHSLNQRCCRWLLMTYDRMQSNSFLLTHEFLAMMLGVRRAGVTVAAGALQRAKLIRYARGNVTVLDVDGLKKRACECYEISKREFDRLLEHHDAPKSKLVAV
jgi:CRP-like cAMP-binding protein